MSFMQETLAPCYTNSNSRVLIADVLARRYSYDMNSRADLRAENRRVGFNELRKKYKTQVTFAEALGEGFSPSFVSQLLSGHRNIGDDLADKIERSLGIESGWLDAFREDRHNAHHDDARLSLSSDRQAKPKSADSMPSHGGVSMQSSRVVGLAKNDYIAIPQYAAGGAMGHGLTLPEQPGVIERWTVDREWLEKNARGYTSAKNLCIVTGFGPSMRPMFNPGDPLLVDRGITSVPADGIYFFRIGNEGFIKQLQKIPTTKGVVYRAKSANPDYDPFEISSDMDFEVLGKVLRVWCGTDF